ncbi:MAG TPA: phosphatase domain-containing protein [Longimicrobiaceae bacterium]|nr:phosphatase domain-containing protein [Longimicrobiaceae bacterium]
MNWRQGIHRFVHRVEEKVDAHRQRHGWLTGRNKPARIEAYRGYGCADRAWLKGRVLRGTPIPAGEAGDSVWLNLASMVQRFESDEVPGARVRVRFSGGEHVVTADHEGYFECWLEPRPPFGPDHLWHEVVLELVDPPPPEGEEPHRALGHLLVPPPQTAFGVISDLDDTVIRTDVTSTLRMMRTVFLGNARTRSPFPGVAAFYRALEKGAGETPFNPVFYVSSSPWNLYDLLTEFLTVQQIPLGPLMLRDWGITRDELLPRNNAEFKFHNIRRILDLFPALPFLLIGDSGQEDPEIYHRVVHEYPDRIRAVYIRNIKPHPERVQAVRLLAAEVEKAGSTLLLTDDTLAAARHAAEQGWISPAALPEIGEVARQEEKKPVSAETRQANRELSTTPPEQG